MQENNLIPYRKSTELCRFMPVPKSVLDMGLSYGAVIAYLVTPVSRQLEKTFNKLFGGKSAKN